MASIALPWARRSRCPASLLFRVLAGRRTLDTDIAERLVDLVLDGILPLA